MNHSLVFLKDLVFLLTSKIVGATKLCRRAFSFVKGGSSCRKNQTSPGARPANTWFFSWKRLKGRSMSGANWLLLCNPSDSLKGATRNLQPFRGSLPRDSSCAVGCFYLVPTGTGVVLTNACGFAASANR